MSYFDDYVATGLCCSACGELISLEEDDCPGICDSCAQDEEGEE